MKSIDVKSLIIGILGTLLVIACAGASNSITINPKNAQIGAYGIACVAQARECYVLDTRIGKILGRVNYKYVKFNPNLIHQSVYDD